MMLSDELLRIGMTVDINSEASIKGTVVKMYCIAYNDTIEKIGNFKDNKTIISSFRRTNWIWNDVRKKLMDIGLDFVAEDGFKSATASRIGNGLPLFGES